MVTADDFHFDTWICRPVGPGGRPDYACYVTCPIGWAVGYGNTAVAAITAAARRLTSP